MFKRGSRMSGGFGFAAIRVIIMLVLVMGIIGMTLQTKKLRTMTSYYQAEIDRIVVLTQEQEDRQEQLKTFPEYVESREYYEKIAREKLNLVYPDEYLFRPEDPADS